MKKFLSFLFIFVPLLAGCGGNTPKEEYSELRGVFKNYEISDKYFKKTFDDSSKYLFGTNYPQFNLNDDTLIKYEIDQKLTLKKDYTYRYEYTISLCNSGTDIVGKIVVDIAGTFTYEVLDPLLENYYVELSNPLAGSETIYSCYIPNTTVFDYWTYNEKPAYSVDILSASKSPIFTYDDYIKGRKVKVSKALSELDSNTVYDALYFKFILDDICKYSVVKPSR